ncbi:MAG TPA: ABC transporter permease [Streptosporangiaceae bacterium]
MTSSVEAMTAPVPVSGGSRALRRLTLTEAKLFMRERVGLIWGVGFPIVLLIIFGSIPGFRKPISSSVPGLTVLDAYIPILVALVIAMLALSALPSVLASYREKGVLRRMATTPVGPGRVLAAQLAVNVVTFLVTLVLLLAVARLAYGVPLARQFGGFVLAVGFAIAALFGIGLFIAAIASTGAATRPAAAARRVRGSRHRGHLAGGRPAADRHGRADLRGSAAFQRGSRHRVHLVRLAEPRAERAAQATRGGSERGEPQAGGHAGRERRPARATARPGP